MEAVGTTLLFLSGIAVGAIMCHYTEKAHKKRKQSPNETSQGNPSLQQRQTKLRDETAINLIAAKYAFTINLDKFVGGLDDLIDGNFNSSEWTDIIIDINDKDLVELWKKIHNNTATILRILSSWGLKPDMCSSFICTEPHRELYITTDASKLLVGKKYTVLKHCWIYTATNSCGDSFKKVIKQGIVS